MERECSICGRMLNIVLNDEGYIVSGGHFFGRLPDGEEYWECDECAEDEDAEEPTGS